MTDINQHRFPALAVIGPRGLESFHVGVGEMKQASRSSERHHKKIETWEMLSSFFDSANEGFMLLDEELRFVQVNPQLEIHTGLTNDELRGRRLQEVFPTIIEPGRLNKYLDILRTGAPIPILEKTLPSAIGERILNIYAFKVGEGLGIILNDITDLDRYERRLEALHEHAVKLASTNSIGEISEISLEIMSTIFQFEFMSFLEAQGSYLVGVDSRGAPLTGFKLPLDGNGITVKAARTKKSIRINDLRENVDFLKGSTDSLSELAVPVVVDGAAVAVLNAESVKLGAFTEQDQRLLEILSSHVASAIHRITAEEKIGDAEVLTRALMNEVGDGIFVIDLENNFIEVNRAIERELGYTREELLRMNARELDTPDQNIRFPQRRRALLKDGYNLYETEFVARNGEVIPIEVSAHLITHRGRPAVIGITRDLRQRRRAEAALRESEKLYRTILESAPNPIGITVDGKIVYANPSRLRLTGSPSFSELEGRDMVGFAHPDDVKMLIERVASLKNGDPPQSYEFRVRKNDGSYANVEATSTPIRFRGNQAILHVLHDVTQRRLYEERLTILHDYARNLVSAATIKDAARLVGDAVRELLDTSFGSVGVVAGDVLRFEHVYGVDWNEGGEMPINGPGITTRAVRTGETQLIRDVEKDPDYFEAESKMRTARSEVVVPIKVDDRVVAVINVENQRLDAYSWDAVKILEILGNHFSSAIRNIQYVEMLRYEESQTTTLHEFTNRLAEAKSVEEASAIAADSLKTLLKTTNGSLSFVEDGTLHHRYIYGVELVEEYIQSLSGGGVTVRAVNTGEPQLVPDVAEDPAYQIPEGTKIETRSELAVPVRLEGRVVAVINAESPQRCAFTLRDQRLLEILAMHLSSAFTRIRDNESKERYRNRLEALNKLVARLDSAQSPTETALIARDMIQSLSPTEHARLALVQGEELVAVIIPESSQRVARLPLSGRGITVKAVKQRRTIYVEDTERDPDFLKGSIETQSELVVPLFIGNHIIGVLNIESTLKNAFNPDDIKLAETLGLHISSTLERLQLDAERLDVQLKLQRKEYEAEQVRELERMKTRFISTATHEIRTPLTSIKGYTELIREELRKGELDTTNRYFEVVERNVNRLVNLTDDLLDTQRIEEGRMILNPTTFRVNALLKDIAAEMTPLLSQRSQRLRVTGGKVGGVRADRSRLMQVLVNLISNASKFSPVGSAICLSVERGGYGVLFSVRDEGVGLDTEDLPRLFKPFPGIRVEGNPEGTGLGLSISRGIVELHGGRIWAESEGRGRGATFLFTIPEAKT